MKPGDVRRTAIAMLLTSGLLALSGGCDSDTSGSPGDGGSSLSDSSSSPVDTSSTPGDTSSSGVGRGGRDELNGVRVTVVQQRIDEGTRRIAIQVSTDAETSLQVVGVQLKSAGFQLIPATSKDTMFPPGRVIDLTTVYGKPLCGGVDPTKRLSAVLTVDDSAGSTSTYEVPVTGEGVGLIRRLHDAECAQFRLRQAASVSYTDFTRARVAGDEVLAGALELERPDKGGSGEVIIIDSLSGSVLFDFRPVAGTKPGFVARLATSAERLRLPVLIGSSGRCDQHARSQSTQTFLFSAYVRVGSGTEHREIMIPSAPLQRQALALLDDVC